MQESRVAFSAGQHVIVRDERWAVLHTTSYDAACLLTLRGIDVANRDQLHRFIAPFDRVCPLTTSAHVRQRSRRAVLAAAGRAIADAAPWSECWTAAHANIELHAWQMEPAIAAVSGTLRILLADRVGLGKTIQAALIIAELSARALVDRVLVLTPAALREQWANELTSRFAMTPVVFDQPTLSSTAASLPPDVNPWTTSPLIISSIDLVKRPEVRQALDAAPFDLLVVDEAHHLTPSSDRGAVAAAIATRVPWVVLASATPHSGDADAYAFLTALGSCGDEPLRVFSRTRVPAGKQFARRSRLLMITPTEAERELFDATREYFHLLSTTARDHGGRLAGSVIARRAASSAHAALATLSRRLALLTHECIPESQPLLPWEEADRIEDSVGDAVLGAPGLADVRHETDLLRRLEVLARDAATQSSKFHRIRELLTRTTEQMIVFSEYRDVVLEIASALRDLAPVVALHGGLSPRERVAAIESFTSGAARVLVATDAAGEGLNLQARCRLVINVELPWTPLRLEQRIGRVDRLGQTRRVHAIHLAHRDSYEGTVIARLERRRALATRAFEPARDAEDTYPARVRRLRALVGLVGDGRTVPAAARVLPARRAATEQAGAVYSARAPVPATVIVLFTVPVLNASGEFLQREVVAIRVCAHATRVLRRRTVRSLARAPQVRTAISAVVASRALEAQSVTARLADALERRIPAMLRELESARKSQAWQASLFDRRAEQEAQHSAARWHALRTPLVRRLATAAHLRRLQPGEPQLVAAWLSGR